MPEILASLFPVPPLMILKKSVVPRSVKAGKRLAHLASREEPSVGLLIIFPRSP